MNTLGFFGAPPAKLPAVPPSADALPSPPVLAAKVVSASYPASGLVRWSVLPPGQYLPAALTAASQLAPTAGGHLAAAALSLPQLTGLLAQVPVALCLLLGSDYVVQLFNPLAGRVWGQPAAQMLGRPFLETLPEAAVASYAVACAAVWQNGQAVTWPELPVTTTGKALTELEVSYFTLSFQPFRTPAGTLAGVLLVAQDVTPLLRARRELLQLQAELATTIAGLADFVEELTRPSGGPAPAP